LLKARLDIAAEDVPRPAAQAAAAGAAKAAAVGAKMPAVVFRNKRVRAAKVEAPRPANPASTVVTQVSAQFPKRG